MAVFVGGVGIVVADRSRFRRFLYQRSLAFALRQPDIIDGMLDAMQAGAVGEHPAGEDAPQRLVGLDLVDLGEGIGARRLGRRARDNRRAA